LSHATIARWLLSALCGAQGMGTLAIDLNRTHASNPLWLRHARFHLVWQAISYAMLSAVEVAMILTPGSYQEQRFYLAAILASIPMLSCVVAFVARDLYGGGLHDPNGIPPLRVVIFGSERLIDLNLAAEAAALLILASIVVLYRLR
jgi:hypothetical protein